MMKGVCKFFETGKKCPYGDRCRFKHKLSSSNSATPGQKGHNRQTSAPSSSAAGGHPNGSPSNDNDHANLLKKWLYYVPKEKRKSRPLGDDELAKFVGLALRLLESSADNMQLVISVLGEECGLVRIREIINRNFENIDDNKLEAFIAALLLPYFRILSHDTML
ncbi:hypothetical protein CERZMDRAFT_86340 [Cercospora zeae-maydis SCOH1-5]|uniref:C3H1-type domain-containing protein n=1 Tax=Cercospora zeae-maydis SCOH1-5 TaxID=717836 RepID=A0A6A6FA59_9PEZI|nr:hypothetical protein CERZMDRAFT_86340 [Cercospora zeae-maydis SCOH1-5]